MSTSTPTAEQTRRYVGHLAAGVLSREPFTLRAAALAESFVVEAYEKGWEHVPGALDVNASPILAAADDALQTVRATIAEQQG